MSEKTTDRFFGCITFWRADKGFGFANPDDIGDSVFVHASQIRKIGLSELTRGQRVSYGLGPDRMGKMMAVNVELRAIDREEHRERREEVRKRVAEVLAKQVEVVYALEAMAIGPDGG
jgi:cold shock protein